MAEDVPEPGVAGHGEEPLPEAGVDDALPEAGSVEDALPEAGSVDDADGVEGAPADAGAADEVEPDAAEQGASPVAGEAVPAAPALRAPARPSRRTLVLSAALVAIIGVIFVDVVVIVKGAKKSARPDQSVARAVSSAPPPSGAVPPSSAAAFAMKPVDAGLFLDYDDGEQPHDTTPEHHAHYKTVQQAANRTCSTKSVDGLSRQIIRQSRCFDRSAFVPVPRRPNLKIKSNVYLYLEAPARRHLLNALDAHRNKTMVVNSALRTVAQQYVLQQWYRNKRCGITLAALPGESNHETGLALDIAHASSWRSALEAQHFHWLGKIDGMHFDYKGPGAATGMHADVKAFQQLWNENHPKDRIPDSGRYTPATEERLKKSPAAGFPRGPHCG